jgi:hypothetical protein
MAAQKRSVLLAAVARVLLASFVLLSLTGPAAAAAADQLAVSGELGSSNCQLAGVQSACARSVAVVAPGPHCRC